MSGGIGGILIASGRDACVVSFCRGAVGLLFVLVWIALSPHDNGLDNYRLWFWSAVAGCGVAGNFLFYLISIAQGSVAIAATLMCCAPVFVYLVSFALKLEKPSVLKSAAIAVVMLGILLFTEIHNIGASKATPVAVIAGLLAGVSYALFIFGFMYASEHGSPQAILAVAFSVLAGILVWPGDNNQIIAVLNSPDWILFAGLGVRLSFVLYIVGLHLAAPAVASIVAMIEPVTASLFCTSSFMVRP